MAHCANLIRLIGLEAVGRVSVLIREDGHCFSAQLVGGSKGTNGDFTAVGYQNLLEHWFLKHRIGEHECMAPPLKR